MIITFDKRVESRDILNPFLSELQPEFDSLQKRFVAAFEYDLRGLDRYFLGELEEGLKPTFEVTNTEERLQLAGPFQGSVGIEADIYRTPSTEILLPRFIGSYPRGKKARHSIADIDEQIGNVINLNRKMKVEFLKAPALYFFKFPCFIEKPAVSIHGQAILSDEASDPRVFLQALKEKDYASQVMSQSECDIRFKRAELDLQRSPKHVTVSIYHSSVPSYG